MKVNIMELLSYRDLRAVGTGKDMLSEDGLFIYKRHQGAYRLCFGDAPEIAVDEFITPELYEEATAFTGDEATEDFVFLAEILLNIFQYRKKKQVINQRLKLFCLKQIIFQQHHDTAELATLFRFLLFFHPCSEDYIDRFSLNKDGFLYKGSPVDLLTLITNLFDNFINHKDQFPSLADFSAEHLSVSKVLVLETLKMMLPHVGQVPYVVPGKGGPVLLTAIFSQPQAFFDIYNNNKEEFFRLLKESQPAYTVKSWDDDPEAQAAVYYGTTRNDTIEAYFNRPARVLRRKKYLVEFFVDMYVFYILCSPDGLKTLLEVLEPGNVFLQQILTILFSHPFYNGEAKVRLIESGLYKQLPEGFWKERINKMAANM
ncbi:hypothetical protein HHL17_06225 [Chitinophaga sp. G-6-1-13]|uniref:Uncharacterized protein n=1 Tax=Chitinophaga fulva TaxID=2728842 RepID=A0A848GH84_9BACT|nr:hypothetical protein [Chitinophaga fulva]NML36789.1 hypothetical protein [Chitinophaga fulva]